MFEESKLNFSDRLDSTYKLNFGVDDSDEDLLTYIFPLNLEFYPYESIFVVADKIYHDDNQEVKTIRLALVNKDTGKAVKRFYGIGALTPGESERYSLEANYQRYKEKLTREDFHSKYLFRVEVLVTDLEQKGFVEDISALISNFNFYLKRVK